jgi:hypothetical protein
MQIVKEIGTHRAVLMFADDAVVLLDGSGLSGPDISVTDISSETHEVVTGSRPEPSLYWVPGALSFDGAWGVYDPVTYDAQAARAQATYEKNLANSRLAAIELCRQQRAAEYPPMADYIDGIVKGDTAQTQTYIDACLAVKAKYPKPQ